MNQIIEFIKRHPLLIIIILLFIIRLLNNKGQIEGMVSDNRKSGKCIVEDDNHPTNPFPLKVGEEKFVYLRAQIKRLADMDDGDGYQKFNGHHYVTHVDTCAPIGDNELYKCPFPDKSIDGLAVSGNVCYYDKPISTSVFSATRADKNDDNNNQIRLRNLHTQNNLVADIEIDMFNHDGDKTTHLHFPSKGGVICSGGHGTGLISYDAIHITGNNASGHHLYYNIIKERVTDSDGKITKSVKAPYYVGQCKNPGVCNMKGEYPMLCLTSKKSDAVAFQFIECDLKKCNPKLYKKVMKQRKVHETHKK
jgi:hypothetical protein